MISKADLVRSNTLKNCQRKPAKAQLGVAADIGHINTKSNVTGYQPDADGLKKALTGSEIVLIPAGVPRKPGMTRDGTLPIDGDYQSMLLNTGCRSLQHQRLYRPRPRQSLRGLLPRC